MSGFRFDPYQSGLRKILREWEELALRYVWSEGDNGAASRPIWENVNTRLGEGESISRASIIFFMNRLVDQGVLGFRDATGKGGHHKIYYPLMDARARKGNAVTHIPNLIRCVFAAQADVSAQASKQG